MIREDADLKLIFHGEVSLGFAFFSKFIMPLAIGHHRLVTWVMFIIAWLPVRLRDRGWFRPLRRGLAGIAQPREAIEARAVSCEA